MRGGGDELPRGCVVSGGQWNPSCRVLAEDRDERVGGRAATSCGGWEVPDRIEREPDLRAPQDLQRRDSDRVADRRRQVRHGRYVRGPGGGERHLVPGVDK